MYLSSTQKQFCSISISWLMFGVTNKSAGAVVKLQCNNTKYRPVEATATTDRNGYFFLMPKNVTTAASHKCKVFLVSSPLKTCNVPTNLHAGSVGAILVPVTKLPVPPPPYQIFNVGPFAFEPSKKIPCPRWEKTKAWLSL